jgi:Spy/CpxP family protein refolding chaperone
MKLQRVIALATVLALMAGFASTASAQRGQGGGRGGFGMMGGGTAGLVMMKPVQEELKLTPDQTKEVTKIADDAMEAGRESFGNLRDASPEDRRAAMEKFQKQAAETDKKIAAALKPEQAARLKELSIQRRGVGALLDPEVATTLKLSDDQKSKLGEALRFGGPGGSGGGGGGGAGPNASDEERAAARERMVKAREERESKAKGILTAEQNEQFTKLQGKKFDFPAPQGRQGGGGNGGGGKRRATT